MIVFKWLLLTIVAITLGSLFLLSCSSRETIDINDDKPSLAPCPGTENCVSSLSDDPGFKVKPIPFINNDAQASWRKLIKVIQMTGGKIVRHDDRYAHAVYTSLIFRFKDDLQIMLNEQAIDIRSASRVGKSDFGVNRKRVEEIRALYQQ
jgi:uncharacterized protein (DUF1499 family)